ncbi:GDP-mannose 4,6-dehydratase [Parafrigoribacterium mesophilum]|uniref:GDP-mannose 4,6-dehydratase n=1 Tax=Parafrigoribacterium mesophilum TaxID=433646 RepID=UPI0031FD650E
MRTAFITGLTGQDGSYLADQLLAEGWSVHGLVRLSSDDGEQDVRAEVVQHAGDLTDEAALTSLVLDLMPDVIFNLGGISSVAYSWQEPVRTGLVSGIPVATLLSACWTAREASGKEIRMLQASSSEVFGVSNTQLQSETAPIKPVSPYGAAKAFGQQLIAIYRERGLHASSAILFNHESPRRPAQFVTRKITREVARIARGLSTSLTLGNLDVARDWGWAPDYVDAMVRIALAPAAADYVVATGKAHSVRDFVDAAFRAAGIEHWDGLVSLDARFARPADTPVMRGDNSKLRSELGWTPTKSFDEIVKLMVAHDLELLD